MLHTVFPGQLAIRAILIGAGVLLLAVFAVYADLLIYLSGAATEHIRIMLARTPISQAIATGALSASDKEKLAIVLEVRRFASDRLGLPANGSYTLYADIGRPSLGWNVYAAPKYAVEPHRWCFPIAGCVVYRGYFSHDKALDFARQLSATTGLNVYVAPFNAYSTLGYFDDPIVSSLLSLDILRLAALVIHELAHQKLYIPGNSRINEAFATVIEREGLTRFLMETGRVSAIKTVHAAWDAQDARDWEIVAARTTLKKLYEETLSLPEKEAGKKKVLDDLKNVACGTRCSGDIFPTTGDGPSGINNAYLVPFDTYFGEYDSLVSMLSRVNGDLTSFYAQVENKYKHQY